jgi:hypothetical protein
MSFDSVTIVGDYENGNLYAFDLDVYEDNGQVQKWLRSWRPIPANENNLNRTAQHGLQLMCESGVGLNGIDPQSILVNYLLTESNEIIDTENNDNIVLDYATTQGVNPQAMLRWSDDGGHTWSNEHWTQMGRIGQYGFRAFWRRLGMTLKLRDRVYEVSGTDPVKIVITGANLLASPTNR